MQKPKTWMKVVTVAAPLSVIGVVFLSLQINKWSKQWLDKKANENPLYSIYKENVERTNQGKPIIKPEEIQDEQLRQVYQAEYERQLQKRQRYRYEEDEDEE
ncbi:predicted protein [Naegleria gruberi]|uniref:Predicted protein n=1 Tax=Naegleria gruberi TaxID=5762 RepID=D2VWX4_NAEGR|nr:uncharacterized protein NAEGRDRAFT_73537 [Naegleria gruberi]EFC38766.1 predicted protein [Naegleria gruberi]|eukprot:XP_002671510.1 predicted protein [Naegleria gruberi strain NEG-M]